MRQFRIAILAEDQAKMGFLDRKFVAQHGFSVFIAGPPNLLFDSGPSDSFMRNAALLGIDLQTIDAVALSHGHWDHTDGLSFLKLEGDRRPLVAHPDLFTDRHKGSGEYNGTALRREALCEAFDLILTRQPHWFSEDVVFLGEIPRLNDFEAKETPFYRITEKRKCDDFMMDDTAIAMRTDRGLVIITGCSHAGICNITEHARTVCDEKRVHMILGGFHLLGKKDQLSKTIDYFRENPVDHLYPMHCTDLPSLCAFQQNFGIDKLCAGDVLTVG